MYTHSCTRNSIFIYMHFFFPSFLYQIIFLLFITLKHFYIMNNALIFNTMGTDFPNALFKKLW